MDAVIYNKIETEADRIIAAMGGGGTTVESLSVTENGVYTAPVGKAYSPVTVTVDTVPSIMAIDEVTITSGYEDKTIPHSLGQVPDIIMLIPAEQSGSGANNFELFYGSTGLNTEKTDYHRAIVNYINSSGNWDYSANTYGVGWKADATNVYIYANNIQQGTTYYLITVKNRVVI